jgi:hypothetical protein
MSQILFGDDVLFKNGIVFPVQGVSGTTYDIISTFGSDGENDYALVCTNTVFNEY